MRSSDARRSDVVLDGPGLVAWFRARANGRWTPGTLQTYGGALKRVLGTLSEGSTLDERLRLRLEEIEREPLPGVANVRRSATGALVELMRADGLLSPDVAQELAVRAKRLP